MDVGHGVLGLAGRPSLGDGLPFDDVCAPAYEEGAEMRQRYLVAVGGADRDGEAVRGHLTGEGDLTRRRGAYDTGVLEGDVDPSVLAAGIRVVADYVAAQDRAVGRPGPGERFGRRDEQPGEGGESGRDEPRCPSR
jgi:hypothetical protein